MPCALRIHQIELSSKQVRMCFHVTFLPINGHAVLTRFFKGTRDPTDDNQDEFWTLYFFFVAVVVVFCDFCGGNPNTYYMQATLVVLFSSFCGLIILFSFSFQLEPSLQQWVEKSSSEGSLKQSFCQLGCSCYDIENYLLRCRNKWLI